MERSLWGVTLENLAGLLKDIHSSDMRVQTWEKKPFIEALRPYNDVQDRNKPGFTHTCSSASIL